MEYSILKMRYSGAGPFVLRMGNEEAVTDLTDSYFEPEFRLEDLGDPDSDDESFFGYCFDNAKISGLVGVFIGATMAGFGHSLDKLNPKSTKFTFAVLGGGIFFGLLLFFSAAASCEDDEMTRKMDHRRHFFDRTQPIFDIYKMRPRVVGYVPLNPTEKHIKKVDVCE
eukprot:TRINITY_DN11885_c0_g1_i1.p1 TRINITY_DN11885_c0_g1~~TRINITY_DN11885_c0_g1_i1.p1  ORF type:complete len:168 (+),score=30.65 TRINITY_DN11885_c0_g1_i1:83-586(+)